MKNKPDLQNIGNAGEYFIASVLSAHGFTTTITLGRAEAYDIIAINPKGKTVKIQVKTAWYKTPSWRLNEKNEKISHKDFFYALVRLNEMKEFPEFWIVPSSTICKLLKETHEIWLKTPGKKGQKHNDNLGRIFTIGDNKFSPTWWSAKKTKKFYGNVKLLK